MRCDAEVLQTWLTNIHFEEYIPLFFSAGYDMPTISRMTPEDLTAIGITKPSHRRKIKAEIQKLNISDGIPNYRPDTLAEWLKLLRLEEYYPILCHQGYDSIDRVIELTWEDFEEIGVKKLGHQKRLMLAIKRVRDLDSGLKRSSGHFKDPPNNTPTLVGDTIGTTLPYNKYQSSVANETKIYAGQVVPIQTSLRSKSASSPTYDAPTTPELTTFQQIPNNEVSNNVKFFGHRAFPPSVDELGGGGGGGGVVQGSRGRSLESIDRDDNYKSFYTHRHHVHNSSYPMHPTKNGSGYETDTEVINQTIESYELDGTATLHRPKGMIKTKPVAKIVAKTRQIESSPFDSISFKPNKPNNCLTVEEKAGDLYKSLEKTWSGSVGSNSCEVSPAKNVINYKNQSNEVSSQPSIYATLKRKNTPPPPPKRTNSMKTSSSGSYIYRGLNIKESEDDPAQPARCCSLEAMQEQAFATCVKSLASHFLNQSNKDEKPPVPARNHSTTPRLAITGRDVVDRSSEDEFPPPPSPLPHSITDESLSKASDYEPASSTRNTPEHLKMPDKETMSSSSSSESMPFANDNIGTIKQRLSLDIEACSPDKPFPPTSVMSAPPSVTTSPFATILRKPKNRHDRSSCNSLAGSKPLAKKLPLVPKPGNSSETIDALCSPVFDLEENTKSHSGLSLPSSPLPASSTEIAIDDIELMLANLSNQLDAILESELLSD